MLAVVAVLPTTAPQWTIITTIGFVAALQLSLVRTAGSSPFVTIAMSGNLMSTTEAMQVGRPRRDE